MHSSTPHSEQLLVIEPGGRAHHYWYDLWRYRELFLILAWRDVSVRYKQTVIGLLWALIRPLLTMVVFTIIFGRVAGLPSDGPIPYALMVFAGLLPWSLFAASINDAASSLIENERLISKVYFPRLIIPAATIIAALIDLAIGLLLLGIMMIAYQILPSWQILLLPGFLLLAFITSLGPGLWLSALNLKYRDVRYIIPFSIQIGLYISPVGFSSSVIPEQWRLIYALNPMVGVIDGFRWALFGGQSPLYWPGFLISVSVALLLLWLGVRRFRAMERSLADWV